MIRLASFGDIPDLVLLNSLVHNIHVKLFPEVFKTGDENLIGSFFASLLQNENYAIFISRVDGFPAGYIMIRKMIKPESFFKKEVRCVYIDQVIVHPNHTRKGIFKGLLRKAEEQALSWGLDRLELDVWSENSSAVEVYEKTGFKTYNQKMFLSLSDRKTNPKPLVGVSSCLLGDNVRYNGKTKLNSVVRLDIGKSVEFYPVCPETESGMPVPREPMDLFVKGETIRMITLESGMDKTDVISEWIEKKLLELSKKKLCGFILKARSPSCAVCSAKIHEPTGVKTDGCGLFAGALIRNFPKLPIVEEENLQNEAERNEFIRRIAKNFHGD